MWIQRDEGKYSLLAIITCLAQVRMKSCLASIVYHTPASQFVNIQACKDEGDHLFFASGNMKFIINVNQEPNKSKLSEIKAFFAQVSATVRQAKSGGGAASYSGAFNPVNNMMFSPASRIPGMACLGPGGGITGGVRRKSMINVSK